MRYLGIDVHSSASVWCLLDQHGETVSRGRAQTTYPALAMLARQLSAEDGLVAGHEVGTQVYLVHDAFSDAGVPIQAFNAAHLRMIASSRKKTDKRDAYWIARALQTGMTPHPVYVPRGEVRELRRLLSRRRTLLDDRKRWQCRARAHLRARGTRVRVGVSQIRQEVDRMLEHPDGVDTFLLEELGLCERSMSMLTEELEFVDNLLRRRAKGNELLARLQTIPGYGSLAALNLYATVGEIGRFPNARSLAAYGGLVPSVRQTGMVSHYGRLIKEGSPIIRSTMLQCAHVVSRLGTDEARPLRSIYERIYANRGRKKVALVALARHLLKLGFYIWRDGTEYDPELVRCPAD